MCSSLICCCLLGNHLCLSVCADPLPRWEGSAPLILIGSSPCPHQCDPCSDEGLRQSLLSLFFICCWTNLPGAQLSSCPCLSSDQSLTPPHVPTAFRLSSLPALVSPGGTSSAASQIGLLVAPPKHWPLTCLCNFPFLPLSVPPYRLCPSFRAQLQPCSPGRPPCPGEAIGQPLWRVACIMYRCHCPPVQTPYVLRRPSSLALF